MTGTGENVKVWPDNASAVVREMDDRHITGLRQSGMNLLMCAEHLQFFCDIL